MTSCKTIIFSLLLLFNILFSALKSDESLNISRYNFLKRGKLFIRTCFKGILINDNKNKINSQPKISTIIPVYNCQDTIKAVVRSIQNQDMEDIEIILVNDFSKDNSAKIIEELSLEDNRIRIINNENNKGTFFSRNLGVLNSRGKYVMHLDNDDLFMDKNIFDAVFNEAETGNFDIVGFCAVDSPSYDPLISQMYEDYFHNHKDGLIVKQPELNYFPISKYKKFRPNDYHVWGRLVKTNLYQKAINNLGNNAIGEDRRTQFLCWSEDSSMSIVLFHFAESYKFIKKYGIFHYLSKTTASNTRINDEKLFTEIFFLDLIYDFTANNFEGKKYAYWKAEEMRFDNYFSLNDSKNVKYCKAVIKKIIECQYIIERDKKRLLKIYENLFNKNYLYLQ